MIDSFGTNLKFEEEFKPHNSDTPTFKLADTLNQGAGLRNVGCCGVVFGSTMAACAFSLTVFFSQSEVFWCIFSTENKTKRS